MIKSLLFSIVVSVIVALIWGAIAPYVRPYYPEALRIPLSMLVGFGAQMSSFLWALNRWDHP